MADITLTSNWSAPASIRRPAWLDAIAHRTAVLRRRSRRNRYLTITGRSPLGNSWFEAMFASMSSR